MQSLDFFYERWIYGFFVKKVSLTFLGTIFSITWFKLIICRISLLAPLASITLGSQVCDVRSLAVFSNLYDLYLPLMEWACPELLTSARLHVVFPQFPFVHQLLSASQILIGFALSFLAKFLILLIFYFQYLFHTGKIWISVGFSYFCHPFFMFLCFSLNDIFHKWCQLLIPVSHFLFLTSEFVQLWEKSPFFYIFFLHFAPFFS